MKRRFAVLSLVMAAVMLFGCAASAEQAGEAAGTQAPTGGVQTGGEPYKIRDVEAHYLDDAGNVLIRVTYQHVQLTSLEPAAMKINAALDVLLEEFHAERDGLSEHLDGPFLSPESPYFFETTAKVLHCGSRVLSIRFPVEWYMGGVQNSTSNCVNFDLTTGEKLTLKDLLPEKEQEIRQTVIDHITRTAGEDLLEDPAQVLGEIAYEDMDFFVENGQVKVRFPIYLFASGAYGEPVVDTGITLED